MRPGALKSFIILNIVKTMSQQHRPIQKITRINLTIPFDKRINYTTPFQRISFLGSCNGLICFARSRLKSPVEPPPNGPVFICNPITKEYLMLPDIERDCCDTDKYDCRMNAFGYVSSTNEYKVLGIYLLETYQFAEVHIYTLGDGKGWRNLGDFKYRFSPHHGEQGIFANGALYWICLEPGTILTFDLSEETLGEILSPRPLIPHDNWWLFNTMGVLDGFLFFAVYQEGEGVYWYDVYLLKKKNDNHDKKEGEEHQSWVWNKEFRLEYVEYDTGSHYRIWKDDGELLAVTKTGSVLSYKKSELNIYDTKASISKTLAQFEGQLGRIYPHQNTLVSLKELGEEDTKIMESAVDKITWDLSVNLWLSSLSS